MRSNLVADFEAGTIDNSAFGHAEHVFVIWSLIHAHGTLEAIRRFEDSLRRITIESGHPEKYNATITYALAFLVAERVADGPARTWDEFAADNGDLLVWPSPALVSRYPDGELQTARARQTFRMPAGR